MARPARPSRAAASSIFAALAREVTEIVAEETEADIDYVVDVDGTLEIEADSDQMFRVIYNLVRNAVQAFASDPV
jgi:nitrogen-specific signal transduction histidine kinase